MRTLPLLCCLLLSNLGLAQYASGEGPPDESQAEGEGPDEATDGEARSLYDAGTAAFSDGRFEDALARWREAYALSERPELLYNIATALDRLGRGAEAIEEYEAYLEALPEARNENYVRRRLEVLRAEAAEREASTADPQRGAEPSAETGSEAAPIAPAPEPPSRAGPVALFSLAGAAAVAGLATALVANGRYDSLDERCTDGVCPADAMADRDALRRTTRATDALFGVAVLSAVAGVVWWVVGTSGAERETELACGLGRCDLRMRF